MKITIPTKSESNIKLQQFESSMFLDLSYETKTRGVLEGLNQQQNIKNEQNKLRQAIGKLRLENAENILALEKTNNLYIFNKQKSVFTVETSSRRQDQISVIFPSGKIENFSPTLSQGESENNYINTYQLDTACIAVSTPKNCSIIKVVSANLSETIKNIIEIRKESDERRSAITQEKEELNTLISKVEIQKKRSENLSIERKNTEINLEQLRQLLIEKENDISKAEAQKQRVTEDRLSLESSLDSIRSDIELEKNNKEKIELIINSVKNELTTLQSSANKIKNEISVLEQNKSLFDNELSGYNIEGKSQVNAYLWIAAIILTMLLFATGFTVNSGIDIIKNSNDMDMIDLLLSRIPLTIGISLVISMCFALAYFMINQSIKINAERMKFMQASIIAKDMWAASETTTDLSPFDREKLRQQAKIQLIARIFEESSQSKTDSKIMDALIERVLKKE